MVTEEKVWDALGSVMDPEVPFSVVELGSGVRRRRPPARTASRVQLTLTTKGCPLVRRISDDARAAISARRPALSDVQVEHRLGPAVEPGHGEPPRCRSGSPGRVGAVQSSRFKVQS